MICLLHCCELSFLSFILPSNENLLKKALNFTEAHTLFSDDDKAIIHHVKKLLLFNDTVIDWRKSIRNKH